MRSLVAQGRSYRLIGREVGLSKNPVAHIVKTQPKQTILQPGAGLAVTNLAGLSGTQVSYSVRQEREIGSGRGNLGVGVAFEVVQEIGIDFRLDPRSM